MCEYCGCRDIALIGRLSEEHVDAINALGALRRAIEGGDADRVAAAVVHLGEELFSHNETEEAGLFAALVADEYFAPTIHQLVAEHRLLREQVGRIDAGEWDVLPAFEVTLRDHIHKEENGLFPATAVAVDGPTWERIDELTHAFDHAGGRDHDH